MATPDNKRIKSLERENAELRRQLDEALAQQTATAEVLGVINSSPGDLAPVFDAILEKARTLCGAAHGDLWLYDGEVLHLATTHGEPGFAAWLRQQGPMPVWPGSPAERLLHGADHVQFEDPIADGLFDAVPEFLAQVQLANVRSTLFIPMRKDAALLGTIIVYRREVQRFADKQIALLQNFAAEAVIAMENARLITETREALEQQTATAEVLQVINSSPGDLAPVFDAILEKAHWLCGAEYGSLQLFDGEMTRAVACRGLPDAFVTRIRQGYPAAGNPALQPLLDGAPFSQTDLASVDQPTAQRAVEIAGMRTFLAVALRRDGVLLGHIAASRREVRPFSDKQIALLQNFAAQAVIAMENARLLTATREALEQQTATAEVLQVINASPGDLTPVFDTILDKAHRLCGATRGTLFFFDGETFRAAAMHGYPPPAKGTPPRTISVSEDPRLASLLAGERLIHVPDLTQVDDPIARAVAERGGVRTNLLLPLRREGTLLGVISCNRDEVRPFSDKEIALLENFAAQAVIAMENARLLTETREALDQQTATAEVLGVINSSPGNLAPVFEAMVEKARRLCNADSGHLALPVGNDFHTAVVSAMSPEMEATIRAVSYGPGRGTAVGRALMDRRAVQIADIGADPEHAARHAAREGMIRTILGVPLLREGEPIGAFGLSRARVEPFTERQIELVQTFAAQAVIAIENARLITETREALDQQTATAEVLGVINSSPGDLAPVFDAMLEKAMRLCDAAFGTLATFDGSTLRTAATRGVPPEYARFRMNNPPVYGPKTAPGRFIAGERLIHNIDLKAEEAYLEGEPNRRALVDIGGARSALQVALRKDDALLGSMTIYRQAVRPFADKQIALLQNFAAQAVIAMENARLITETREALEQQTATAEVLGVINASPGDLKPVFDAILEKAHSLCGAAFGSLVSFDGEFLRSAAERNLPPAWADFVRGPMPLGGPDHPATRLMRGEPLLHIEDLAELARTTTDPMPRAGVELAGIRTLLLVPLRKDGAFLGYITAFRQEVRPFTDKQIALLQNFAAQAVIAMENARLLGELRQRTDEVAELNRGLEARVAEQVDELGRVGNLKRFLPPQVAEMVVSQGDERILESHRREIVVVFCDVRGYTAFSETAEPEEVIEFLGEYHAALGPLITRFEGTLSHFLGDGLMVFFNDPVPCPDPAERAVKMAVAMREAAGGLVAAWGRRGHQLGFGAGVAQGYATLGQIGFADRSDYTAIGTVCNLAARLCGEALDGQILLARRVAVAVEGGFVLEELGALTLKGLTQPVAAFNVVGTADLAVATSD